jgi:predicted naringenin-chalcone synthase
MMISKFRMRQDVQSFNLLGMGCGASLISVGLVKDLLQHCWFRGGKALVVSTEIITPNLYRGNEWGFLPQNTLFRCGGAAIMLLNSWSDGRRAWYKLLHMVRVQSNSEEAYNCVYQGQDAEGSRGVRLLKEIVKLAGKCMEKNMTTIGPYVLPLSEQIPVVMTLTLCFVIKVIRKLLVANGQEKLAAMLPNKKHYVPDFKRGIDHFCIHAGGQAVIDGEFPSPQHFLGPVLVRGGDVSCVACHYSLTLFHSWTIIPSHPCPPSLSRDQKEYET